MSRPSTPTICRPIEGGATIADRELFWDVNAVFSRNRAEQIMHGNEHPPGCFSCDLNNYDPTAYDIPGRFGYVRLIYRK